jgi:hypothetical protein
VLSQRFLGLDPMSSGGTSTHLPSRGGDGWSQPDEEEQQDFDPTNRVEAYPDSSSARVNNQRRSVPADLISKTSTPLSMSAPSRSQVKSSHEVDRCAPPQLNRSRAHTMYPTTWSSSSHLFSSHLASQRGIEADSHQGVKVKSPECGEKAFAFARSGNLAQIRTCHGIGSGSRSCTAGASTRHQFINNCHMPEYDDVRN